MNPFSDIVVFLSLFEVQTHSLAPKEHQTELTARDGTIHTFTGGGVYKPLLTRARRALLSYRVSPRSSFLEQGSRAGRGDRGPLPQGAHDGRSMPTEQGLSYRGG